MLGGHIGEDGMPVMEDGAPAVSTQPDFSSLHKAADGSLWMVSLGSKAFFKGDFILDMSCRLSHSPVAVRQGRRCHCHLALGRQQVTQFESPQPASVYMIGLDQDKVGRGCTKTVEKETMGRK